MPDHILNAVTILVIDDEPDSIDVARLLLVRVGVNVITAISGQSGLEQARQLQPKLIICDLSMPEMSGLQFIAALKQDAQIQDIPVVALTAHVMAGDREKTIEGGFHAYLSKPINPRTFVEDLMKLIKNIPMFAGGAS